MSRIPQSHKRNTKGITLVKALVIIPVGLIVLLILTSTFYEARKAYWDYRVREMCEKDGGVRVFERISISREQSALMPRVEGFLGVAPEATARPADPAYIRATQTALRPANPTVIRHQQDVIRRLDGKLVAEAVTYVRSGGDFPSYGFPSSAYCPEQTRLYAQINEIFRIEENAR